MKRPWPLHHIGLKLLALGLGVLLWMVVSGEADRRARPARAARAAAVPGRSRAADRGAVERRRARARRLGHAEPAFSGRHRGGCRSARRARGPAAVSRDAGIRCVCRSAWRSFRSRRRPWRWCSRTRPASRFASFRPTTESRLPGFVVGKVTSVPETVEIVGPESSVKRAAAALTEPLSVAGARELRSRHGTGRRSRFDASSQDLPYGSRRCPDPAGAVRARGSRAAGSVATIFRRTSSCSSCPATVDISVRGTREGREPDRCRRCRRVRGRDGPGRRVSIRCRCTPSPRVPKRESFKSNLQRCRCESPVTKTESLVPKLFGTDGVRGVAGRYPLDRATVRRLGAALVRALPRGTASPRFLVGRDTRESGSLDRRRAGGGRQGRRRRDHERRRRPDTRRRVPDAQRGVRRRRGDFGIAQSVRGQRHQGLFRPRRKIHRARRARGRGDRRRLVMDAPTRRRPSRCLAPIWSARISTICVA